MKYSFSLIQSGSKCRRKLNFEFNRKIKYEMNTEHLKVICRISQVWLKKKKRVKATQYYIKHYGII